MQHPAPPPPPPAPPAATAPGLWTTPVRGRVAVVALAWVLGYGAAVVAIVVAAIAGLRALGGERPAAPALVFAVIGGTAVAALLAVRLHLLRRHGLRWADVGLRRPARSPIHLLWQIPAVMISAVIASMVVLIPLGVGPDEGRGNAVGDLVTAGPVVTVLGLLLVAVLVPVAEEVVFRGILLPALRARLRAVPGLALAGAVFAVVHVVPPALPYLLVVGISLCVMAEWYRSIVPGIVLHGVNNAVVLLGVLTA